MIFVTIGLVIFTLGVIVGNWAGWNDRGDYEKRKKEKTINAVDFCGAEISDKNDTLFWDGMIFTETE